MGSCTKSRELITCIRRPRSPPTAPCRPFSPRHAGQRGYGASLEMELPTESTITRARDRLKGSGSDKAVWVTSFWYQLKVLLDRQSKQSRGEVRVTTTDSMYLSGGCLWVYPGFVSFCFSEERTHRKGRVLPVCGRFVLTLYWGRGCYFLRLTC